MQAKCAGLCFFYIKIPRVYTKRGRVGLVRRRQGGVAVAVSALQDQNRRPPGGRCSPAGSAAPALVACKNTPALKGRGSGGTLEGSAVQWPVQPRHRAPQCWAACCGAAVLAVVFICLR